MLSADFLCQLKAENLKRELHTTSSQGGKREEKGKGEGGPAAGKFARECRLGGRGPW